MTEEIGIVETKEALVAIAQLVKFVIAAGKDGYDINDLGSLFAKIVGDETFKKIMIDAVVGANKIPSEISNIKLNEGIELLLAVIAEVKA